MLLELVPDFPDAKTFTSDPDIVEEEQSAGSNFRQPGIDVMADGVFRVQAIEVKNVDTVVSEPIQSFIKVAPEQGGKRFIVSPIVLGDLGKGGLVVLTCMVIAAPGVHAKTARPGPAFRRSLAKGEVAFTAIDAQLDEQARAESGHQVVSKIQVWCPRSDAIETGFEIARRQIWLGHRIDLKMHSGDHSPGGKDAKIEEELGRNKTKVKFRWATMPKPPDAEQKQERQDRLITMENK